MTTTPPEQRYGAQPPQSRGFHVPLRVWLLVALIAAIVIITATGGIRDWWAHRLHDMTSGNKTADYLIGLVVGLLPVIGVGIGVVATRGRGRLHRAWRVFLYGGIGFVVTYFLSPSITRVITDSASRHVFEREAPSYLPGVFTGTAVWLVGLVAALFRVRSRRRSRRVQPPEDGRRPRVIDV